jgi:segregation and condensation protein A
MTPPVSSPPLVETDAFEGPLDLLLDEVRRQNVDIEDIALAPVVARFLEYVRTAGERRLNLDIEWLHMAATLIYWKSRALLPAAASAAAQPETDPVRDELVRQLLAHRQEAARELGRRQSAEENRFARRQADEFRGEESGDEGGETEFVSVWDLMQQARELARWAAEYRTEQRHRSNQTITIGEDEVTVPEMTEYLRAQLAGAGKAPVDGLRLLQDQPTASRRACLFLGMLEMARGEQLQIEQEEAFAPLWLRRSV